VKLELDLALRLVRRRRGLLFRGTAAAAFSGVALATAALVIVLALMTGYRHAIATALQQGNAHVVGFALSPMTMARAEGLARAALRLGGVREAQPVSYLTGLAEDPAAPSNPLPVVIKAPRTPPPYTGLTTWPGLSGGAIPAVLGYRLARRLGVAPGQMLHVMLPPSGGGWLLPGVTFRIVGTFHLEMADFDESWLVAPLDRLLRSVPGLGVAGVELKLDDPMAVQRLRPALEKVWPGLVINDWLDMNPALFAALRWQTLSLFLVLSLVAAVASFQVSSALVVVAAQKRRTMGMLHAMGMPPREIRRTLRLVGLFLGGTGVAVGLGLGVAVSALMTWFRVIRFPPGMARVYMVEHIPLLVRPVHLAAIVSVCALVIWIASAWPARRAARMDPVTALRSV